ncbi:hypothetical protein EDD99_0613 [Streptomyces sp. 846.5]|nr:hypothetical protein [Streptomyces sp. 846.5]TDU02224.1 hypothetical protein EDD99_0613 [Streptomyces sp. 846.5]
MSERDDPGTGWFLGLCGPLALGADGDGTASAPYLPPPGCPADAGAALALEALHQIACRLAAAERGVDRCVPARLVEYRPAATAADAGAAVAGVLRARVLRSGRLSTVEASLDFGPTTAHATLCTQEVR